MTERQRVLLAKWIVHDWVGVKRNKLERYESFLDLSRYKGTKSITIVIIHTFDIPVSYHINKFIG